MPACHKPPPVLAQVIYFETTTTVISDSQTYMENLKSRELDVQGSTHLYRLGVELLGNIVPHPRHQTVKVLYSIVIMQTHFVLLAMLSFGEI